MDVPRLRHIRDGAGSLNFPLLLPTNAVLRVRIPTGQHTPSDASFYYSQTPRWAAESSLSTGMPPAACADGRCNTDAQRHHAVHTPQMSSLGVSSERALTVLQRPRAQLGSDLGRLLQQDRPSHIGRPTSHKLGRVLRSERPSDGVAESPRLDQSRASRSQTALKQPVSWSFLSHGCCRERHVFRHVPLCHKPTDAVQVQAYCFTWRGPGCPRSDRAECRLPAVSWWVRGHVCSKLHSYKVADGTLLLYKKNARLSPSAQSNLRVRPTALQEDDSLHSPAPEAH